MMIGLVGAPNKGKSTIFSALTLLNVAIADYPFTTIRPNLGVTYASRECVEKELGVKCKPRHGLCVDGIREIPINVIDIAGLVPGASMGKGMGSQFLNDLVAADVLIQVIDASGRTDIGGNSSTSSDPVEEVRMVEEEMSLWLAEILMRHNATVGKRLDGAEALREVLSSFNTTIEQIRLAAERSGQPLSGVKFDAESAKRFAGEFLKVNKPILVAANKMDMCDSKALVVLKQKLQGHVVVGCSGAVELALRKAAKAGSIRYQSGKSTLEVSGTLSKEQEVAISYTKKYIAEHSGTGIQELINTAVFKTADKIVVYPVENENKYTDHFGNVLPDALLLANGSTTLALAAAIHTDLAQHMLYAVDARTKNRLAKDHPLKDNDVVRIVSAAK